MAKPPGKAEWTAGICQIAQTGSSFAAMITRPLGARLSIADAGHLGGRYDRKKE